MKNNWKNLAPDIVRQRVVMEALTPELVTAEQIEDYLVKLSAELKMRPLRDPYTYPAEDIGFGGWIHWITSGAHVYSYKGDPSLVSIDAYTCKPFDPEKAVAFTKKYFNTIEIVWQEVGV